MGRPTKYSDEYAEHVVAFCRDGFSLTAFAAEIGVARSTINEWGEQHPEFSEALSRAKAVCAKWWEERAREVALKGGPGGQATMVVFALRNLNSDDFKEVERREHTGANGGPIATTVEAQQTVEAKRAEARRMVQEAFAKAAVQEHADA